MKRVLGVFLILISIACGKKEPKPPEAVTLTFPLQNSLCTTGVEINNTTSQVTFTWLEANHVDTYELRVSNLSSNITQTVSSVTTSASLPLEKGAPFSYMVITRNKNTPQSAASANWQFYNSGSQTSFAPFQATVISPASGATTALDINNEITLEWQGADVDNDIESFEIYVDTENPPINLQASPNEGNTSIKMTAVANTIYYWQIVTKDSEGNTSNTSVYSFKVI